MLKKREAMKKMAEVAEMDLKSENASSINAVRFDLQKLEQKIPELIKIALNQKPEKTAKLDKENTFVEISSTGNIEFQFDSMDSNGVIVTMIELDTMEVVLEHNLENEVIVLAELMIEEGK